MLFRCANDKRIGNYSAGDGTITTPRLMAVDHDPWGEAIRNIDRDNLIRTKIGLVVNHRYKIVSKISFGSYGSIFVGEDVTIPDRHVSVKFEILPNKSAERKHEDMHLLYEYDIYKVMQGAEGIPNVHWYGVEFDHEIMVMDILGPSLEHLFGFCSRVFSIETIAALGEQMLRRIWHVHDRGYVHRDIKSENFLMGIGVDESRCYIIDFGLARRYRFKHGSYLRHIAFRRVKNLVGTAKYASLNSHFGNELSRRDDLESLGYILVEFLLHELPWKDLHSRNRTKEQTYRRIKNKKESINWNETCPPIEPWIRYCRGLPFEAAPNYDYLLGILRHLRSLAAPAPVITSNCNRTDNNQSEASTTSRLDVDDGGGAAGAITTHHSPMFDEWANGSGWPTTSSSAVTSPTNGAAVGFCPDNRRLSQPTNSQHQHEFDWICQCREDDDRRYSFECQFRWTLPRGHEPKVPPDRQFGFGSFGYG